ncbi:MAG TPA: hypothetical protein VJO35_15425 [Terriglobales bacterium]|nr:hypothetical protein [Terriglobales bacterium]
MERLFVTILVLLTSAAVVSAEEHTSTVEVSKNPTAVSILEHSLQRTFGTYAANSLRSIKGSGHVEYYSAGRSNAGELTLESKPGEGIRLESTLEQGKRILVISPTGSRVQDINGLTHTLEPTALNVEKYVIPFLELSKAVSDESTSVLYAGLFEIEGKKFYRVHLQKVIKDRVNPNGDLSKLAAIDAFVDADTSLLSAIQGTTHTNGNLKDQYSETLYFWNYRLENGLLLPFTISARVGDQRVWEIQLQTISMN